MDSSLLVSTSILFQLFTVFLPHCPILLANLLLCFLHFALLFFYFSFDLCRHNFSLVMSNHSGDIVATTLVSALPVSTGVGALQKMVKTRRCSRAGNSVKVEGDGLHCRGLEVEIRRFRRSLPVQCHVLQWSQRDHV